MKKLLPLFVVGFLVLSGLGAAAVTYKTVYDLKTKVSSEMITMIFSRPTIEKSGNNYVEVLLEGTSSYLMSPGQPMVPKVIETVELDFGVRNVKVEVNPKNVHEYDIEGEIRPAPALLPLLIDISKVSIEHKKDKKVYSSREVFPSDFFRYHVGCGLNAQGKRVTFVSIHLFPVRYIPATGMLYAAESADIRILYEESRVDAFRETSEYDLVIIAPERFSSELQRFVDHKNSYGVRTILKTTEEIYSEFSGVDKPEQIKYFIKDAIETWDVKYVLLVGGLNSLIWATPRDDTNQGSKDWYVPVRYTNLYDNPKYPLAAESKIHDPGVICDLYYADIYKEGGIFEDWDPNHDGIFAAWGKPGVENDTDLDFYPDVALGRLACRNIDEVKTVVDKIIRYEQGPCDPSWFKKMTVISGDGFLDQEDLDIQWDTNGLPDKEYTIHAQSTNDEDESGPLDVIHVTLDRTVETSLSFNHDDHLNPALQTGYPAPPIAEIVSVSEGDTLGNSDYSYRPTEKEAYLNTFNPWANISYVDGVLHIRGKSYDPQPYGDVTNIHVWVENKEGQVVFSQWRNNTEMYFEGEWTTGEKPLLGRGGGLHYMPKEFEKEILWTSNGRFTGQDDVLEAMNQGSGFLFMSGHGSPNVWADHYPGVPGNRGHGSVTGLQVTTLRPWYPFVSIPAFPIDTLSNKEKVPVAVIGGCHNSQFNVSAIPAVLNILSIYTDFNNYMWTYGAPVPECFSWRLVSRPNGGTIASIGNTGLGYGMPGKPCTTGGGDAWITIEFFRQYGTENQEILGNAHAQSLTSYIGSFDMTDLEAGHAKTVQQWVLLGDPSLMIGGYS